MRGKSHCGGIKPRPFILIACADYAEGKGAAPELLELAVDCERYGALPVSGGVLEQPAGLLRKMRMAKNVYEAYRVYNQRGKKPGESAKWKKEHEDVWNIVSEVEELKAVKRG